MTPHLINDHSNAAVYLSGNSPFSVHVFTGTDYLRFRVPSLPPPYHPSATSLPLDLPNPLNPRFFHPEQVLFYIARHTYGGYGPTT